MNNEEPLKVVGLLSKEETMVFSRGCNFDAIVTMSSDNQREIRNRGFVKF